MIIQKFYLAIAVCCVFFSGLCDTTKANTVNNDSTNYTKNEGVFAEIHTNKGRIVVALEYEKTPLTSANFIGLAEGVIENTVFEKGKRFYDQLSFHRVVQNFMIQGGDPTGTGRGGPGYMFKDEFHSSLKHDKAGVVSMANAGPNTNGSQFFITHQAVPHLDNKHTVFGFVVMGIEVVHSIAQNDVIEKILITRVGSKAKAFAYGSHEAFSTIQKIAFMEIENRKKEKENAAIEKNMDYQKNLNLISKRYSDAIVTNSGLRYIVNKGGRGTTPLKGKRVHIFYTGMLMDGTLFHDASKRKTPFSFIVGVGNVIAGLDEALLSMKKQEKRTLIIPPQLGYGDKKGAGIIPPNSWLIIDIELVDF